ncbi:hypothetical protein [Endozoicomonas sp. ISHI1]|uniref:hypothetical protein n=1 Tax=Endozoicomonas sp. ISHI1 TaxID=2825882 RepID=UPI0021476067|nr:hypothetical protein [Endozoicomonas sp. ISHI1]
MDLFDTPQDGWPNTYFETKERRVRAVGQAAVMQVNGCVDKVCQPHREKRLLDQLCGKEVAVVTRETTKGEWGEVQIKPCEREWFMSQGDTLSVMVSR